jgi:hypothetical protein
MAPVKLEGADPVVIPAGVRAAVGFRRTPRPHWTLMTTSEIVVIGRCTVASCRRPAAQLVALRDSRMRVVRGTLCNQCAEKSRLAAFLLDLDAA